MNKISLDDTDQCVMCGMCLPHCPTYMNSHIEAESPRGRIAMMQGLNSNQLKIDDSLTTHIYNCTGCGSCEAMCPSKVPYLDLLDLAKQTIHQKRHQPLFMGILLYLIQLRAYRLLAFLSRRSGILKFLNFIKLLPGSALKIDAFSTSRAIKSTPLPTTVTEEAASNKTVVLFTGCISSQFDQQTLADTITLLEAAGYTVAVPVQQSCCGALHQHNGQPEVARKLLAQNQQLFDPIAANAIISTSTGCTAQLVKQNTFSTPVYDILDFIQSSGLLNNIHFTAAAGQRLLLHEPCTARNALKLKGISENIVNRIPGITITSLVASGCCGAGGAQFLLQPEISDQLAANLLSETDIKKGDILLSSNIGCALHIGTELMKRHPALEILHPVSFIVRQAGLK